MDRDRVIRRALRISVAFNIGGALLFAFPESPLGQLAGLPAPAPVLYRALAAFFVLLFAGAYAWLARQPTIDRPLVALSAIGKAGFFAMTCVLWTLGEASARGVVGATGDLALAAVFAWWLRGSGAGVSSRTALTVGLAVWLVGVPLVHGGLPWLLSMLGPRMGWVDGRPGSWNLLGLIPIVAGIAALVWVLTTGIAQRDRIPDEVTLGLTPMLLLKEGPYVFSRNPMYVAELVLWLGWTILYGSGAVCIALVAWWAGMRFVAVPREERSLEAQFGASYADYKRSVPRWLGRAQQGGHTG